MDGWKFVHVLHRPVPFAKCEVINLIGFHILWEMTLSKLCPLNGNSFRKVLYRFYCIKRNKGF